MRILIEKGKHSTKYYDVSTDELLAKTALYILTQRFNENWYYRPELRDFYYGVEKETFLTEEEIEDLPQHLQELERKKLLKLKSAKRQLIVKEKTFDEIERIVKEQDDSYKEIHKMNKKYMDIPAWAALRNRSDYEYEEVYLEKLINIKENR